MVEDSIFTGFFKKVYNRLGSVIFAPPIEDPSKPHLRVGLVGGELPVFPPLAMLLCSAMGFSGWFFTKDQKPYIPDPISLIWFRVPLAAIGFVFASKTAKACDKALQESGTTPDFQPVKRIAETGPFAYSRNMMYVALTSLPLSLSVGFDSGWLLYSALGLGIYLDRIVVPAEEKFLKAEFGQSYTDYCKRVPRWFSFTTRAKKE